MEFQKHRPGELSDLAGKSPVGDIDGPVREKMGGGKGDMALPAYRPLSQAFSRNSIFGSATTAPHN
jgi:hypothetical protein